MFGFKDFIIQFISAVLAFGKSDRSVLWCMGIDFVMWISTNFFPAVNYMFKVNYRNARIRCEICLKFEIKITKRRYCHSPYSDGEFFSMKSCSAWFEEVQLTFRNFRLTFDNFMYNPFASIWYWRLLHAILLRSRFSLNDVYSMLIEDFNKQLIIVDKMICLNVKFVFFIFIIFLPVSSHTDISIFIAPLILVFL